MKKLALQLVALAVVLTPLAVHAEGPMGSVRPRWGCGADAKTLCKDVKSGGGAVSKCLMDKVDQIQNAACKGHIVAVKAEEDAVRAACSVEIAKCPGTDFGTGLLKCLGKNGKSNSDGCKAALKKFRDDRKAAKAQNAPAAPAVAPAKPSN